MVEDKPQSAKILEETAEVVTKKASDYSHSWTPPRMRLLISYGAMLGSLIRREGK